MRYIELKAITTGHTLYSGAFADIAACAAQAVADNVCLDGVDLRGVNLVNAALDGAVMRGACFAGANLMGANMSEGDFTGSDFSDVGLQNSCLCFSYLDHCDFDGALFGATDIAGASLRGCNFSTQSALGLCFRDAAHIGGCFFIDEQGRSFAFSRPPVVVSGLPRTAVFFDEMLKVGDFCTPLQRKIIDISTI